MKLQTETRDNTLVVTAMMDRLDAAIAIQFKDEMGLACNGGPARVVLDLSNVDFLDSSGLGAVVAVMKLLTPDQQLELAGMTPNVEKVFRLTRMDSIMTIHKDLIAAFDDIAQAS